MPRRPAPRTKPANANLFAQTSALPSIPAAEVLSFLRETRSLSTWTARDMAESLKISVTDAQRIIPVLELQGYVKSAEAHQWMTTLGGDEVAGSTAPRYKRERVEEALSSLRGRIAEINHDPHAPYKITEAAAFGDFLRDGPRVQSAEVGLQVKRRNPDSAVTDSPAGHRAERVFLRTLQVKGGVLRVVAFEPWMNKRTHRDLL